MASVCNKDCFNCPFEDCINDTMDLDDYREAKELDRELRLTPKQKKIEAKQKAYYEANRDEIAAKKKAYREANWEEIAAKQKVIRVCRRAAGISQARLAEALGITQGAVSMMETGALKADVPAVLDALSALSGMSVGVMLAG